ncbi:MAG: Ni/Fe-hydrogenase cytochrome b subunit [Dehalococcoidales bacterium]|nr:Ni/Fe-hydrogenase cytochrome b subunit [Dehalococcoidales bacterium]
MKQRKFPIGLSIITALIIFSAVIMAIRFIYGLGAVTNLSDGRPWGLWISFDLYCGVALAAGGFIMASVVYIFNLKKYQPLVRSAILTAFLGYTLVILALLVDLGQPWYIWHVIIDWNVHSPLFEVAVCVILYTIVLALEFSPAIFERFNWHIPLKIIQSIQIPLVIAGIVLSTLHQSSLGSTLLMMPETLHTLWYTPILPILFLNSAIVVGLAMVIFETSLTSSVFGHKQDVDILGGLGKAVPYILGFYLLLKLGDLTVSGELGLVFSAYPQNFLWWGEIIIGVILPIILFSMPAVRQSRKALFWSAVLVIIGLIFNRLNAGMLGLEMRPGFSYFPHWMEFAISAGLVAYALAIVWLANHFLPMAHSKEVVAGNRSLSPE